MSDDLLKFGDDTHVASVARLQDFLILAGFKCPDHDIFDQATLDAVIAFQKKAGLKPDGVVGPKTWAAIRTYDLPNPVHRLELINGVIDIRGQHPHPKWYNKQRTWNTIDSVLLHQTGCNMNADPTGWSRLNAHYGVTTEGKLPWVNDETDFIWHAQGLSARSIGIEIEGNFAGIDSVPWTVWSGGGPAVKLTDMQMASLGVLFLHLQKRFLENHFKGIGGWEYVFAHRQSCDTRRSDPGSEIWQKIGVPWCMKLVGEKGMGKRDGGEGFKVGKGRSIPKEWDANRAAKF